MKTLSKPTVVLSITITCVGCDQASKLAAKRFLAPNAFFSFAGDTFRLQYAENTGAFLSLGASLSDPWRHLIFTVMVGIFLLGLLGYLLFNRSLTSVGVLCLSWIFAGGISNLIDRIAYDGRVVDFLNVGIGPLRTGIFNVADMAITFGAIILAFHSFWQKQPK
jgi:signal peptidase II